MVVKNATLETTHMLTQNRRDKLIVGYAHKEYSTVVENSELSLHATTCMQLTNVQPKKLVTESNSVCKSSFTSS